MDDKTNKKSKKIAIVCFIILVVIFSTTYKVTGHFGKTIGNHEWNPASWSELFNQLPFIILFSGGLTIIGYFLEIKKK